MAAVFGGGKVEEEHQTLVLACASPRKPLLWRTGRREAALVWLPLAKLLEAGLKFEHGAAGDSGVTSTGAGAGSGVASTGAGAGSGDSSGTDACCKLYALLGKDAGVAPPVFRAAVVVPAALQDVVVKLANDSAGEKEGKASFTALRSCLGTNLGAAGTASAILAQASSLLTWQRANRYCGSCGSLTMLIEGGVKMRCTNSACGRRFYPRTNPVAIALITHPEEDKVLLQRGKSFPPGIYTCVSGFVDPGETVEDGVRREAMEETGVAVGDVKVQGSQPWPVARGAFGELMIGCRGVATSTTVTVNEEELDDSRWFTRAEVRAALKESQGGDGWAKAFRETPPEGVVLWMVPPPYAIAHWLISSWAHGPAASKI